MSIKHKGSPGVLMKHIGPPGVSIKQIGPPRDSPAPLNTPTPTPAPDRSCSHSWIFLDSSWNLFIIVFFGGDIVMRNIIRRIGQQLRIIILLHFGLVVFRFHYWKTLKPFIFIIFGFSDVSMSPETNMFDFWGPQHTVV